MRQSVPSKTDVVVIGAGISGLVAASYLNEAGIPFHVIEAQDRIGGRIQTQHGPDGDLIEHGAQAFNSDMTNVMSAVSKSGLNLLPLPNIGRHLSDGTDKISARAAIQKLETMLEKASNRRSKFAELCRDPSKSVADAVSLLSVSAENRKLMESNIEELWGRSMDRLQFDHAVDISKRYDSNSSDWEIEIAEGFGALVDAVAKPIKDKIIVSTPVTAVESRREGVTVKTARGTIMSQTVIVAAPPTVAKDIMPSKHWSQPALTSYEAGDLIKFKLRYDCPFWRDSGLSGSSTSTKPSGFATADTTKKGSGKPSLSVFVGGPNARRLAGLSKNSRWDEIKPPLIRMFGKAASNPISWTERIWVDDPWVGGAYNAHVATGAMLKPDAVLRRLEERVTFACAEISTRFPGYVEGAMNEGENAAKRVIKGLGGRIDRCAQG